MILGIDPALAEYSLCVGWLVSTVGHKKGLSIITAGSRQKCSSDQGREEAKWGVREMNSSWVEWEKKKIWKVWWVEKTCEWSLDSSRGEGDQQEPEKGLVEVPGEVPERE